MSQITIPTTPRQELDPGHLGEHDTQVELHNRVDLRYWDVMDPQWAGGATGDGTADDSAAMLAAYTAMVAAGGGTLLFPGGYTFRGTLALTSNVPTAVLAYGAKFKPLDSTTALLFNTTNGSTALGVSMFGGVIDGAGVTAGGGVAILNADRVRLRDVRAENLTTGVRVYTASSGWCEGTMLDGVTVQTCTTGVIFDPVSGTSFKTTVMNGVHINDCDTGLKIPNTANLYESQLDASFWINSNQIGVDIAGDMRDVSARFGFETIGTPTNCTGIWLAATAINLGTALFQLSFTGAINTKVGSASPTMAWLEGSMWRSTSGAHPLRWAQDGDTWERGFLANETTGGGGIFFGPGNAQPDVSFTRQGAGLHGVGAFTFSTGTGSPEGSVVGAPPDVYGDTDGGTGVTLYIKETGDGTNTGWVAVAPGSGGGGGTEVESVAVNTTLTAGDTNKIIVVDSAAAQRTITLPLLSTIPAGGFECTIKRVGTNSVLVVTQGTDEYEVSGIDTKTLWQDFSAIKIAAPPSSPTYLELGFLGGVDQT